MWIGGGRALRAGLAAAVFVSAWIALMSDEPAVGAACTLAPEARELVRALGVRIVGTCVAEPAMMPTGDRAQATSTGLLVVRRVDRRAAFTDGTRTWVDALSGVDRRLNGDRFDWSDLAGTRVPDGAATIARTAPVTVDLVTCLVPGRPLDPSLGAPCADFLDDVIEATERRATASPFRPGDHVPLVDWRGVPVAYVDDGTNAYAHDGTPLFYVTGDLAFTFPGDFLGWVVDGVVRGRDGDAILATTTSTAAPLHPPVAPEPARARPKSPPRRGQREVPTLQAPPTNFWTRLDAVGLPS